MSENTEATLAVADVPEQQEVPAPVVETPEAEDKQADPTPEVAEATTGDDDDAVAEAKAEKMLAEIKSLRARKNALTAEVEAAKAQLAAAQAKASELTEAQSRVAALEAALRQTKVETAVRAKASALRIADTAVEAALRLMDQTALSFDEAGAPSNLDEVLAATVERYPVLTATPQSKALPTTGTVAVTPRAAKGEEALVGLSPRELAAHFRKK